MHKLDCNVLSTLSLQRNTAYQDSETKGWSALYQNYGHSTEIEPTLRFLSNFAY